MTTPNNHTLREFQTLGWRDGDNQDVTIERKDFDAIQKYVLAQQDDNDIQVMRPGHEKLTARNYVGILKTRSGTTVEILPKIDLSGEQQNQGREKEIFLKMLRVARNTPFRQMSDADVRALRYFPLLECFITLFTKELLALTHRGLARHYTPVEENLRVLKGKLLFPKQLRHNLVHRERFYVSYEEFSANRPVNRLLKSALLYLQRLSRTTVNQSRLHQARFYFDEVPQSRNIAADFQRARLDRTMPLYDKLIPWARLFLQGGAPSTYHGGHLSVALMFPMERIFEDYVTARLRRDYPNWQVSDQEQSHYLIQENDDGKREFALRPDIVMRRGGELRILDAKWKHLDLGDKNKKERYKISQPDLYQMFAYGRKYRTEGNTPTLHLIYPRTSNFTRRLHYDFDGDLRLVCIPFDLANETAPAFAENDFPAVA